MMFPYLPSDPAALQPARYELANRQSHVWFNWVTYPEKSNLLDSHVRTRLRNFPTTHSDARLQSGRALANHCHSEPGNSQGFRGV